MSFLDFSSGETGLMIPINVIESTPLSERPETGISSPISPGHPEGSEMESSQESEMETSDIETGSEGNININYI